MHHAQPNVTCYLANDFDANNKKNQKFSLPNHTIIIQVSKSQASMKIRRVGSRAL